VFTKLGISSRGELARLDLSWAGAGGSPLEPRELGRLGRGPGGVRLEVRPRV